MDTKALHDAAQQALRSRDGYFVEFERRTGLTPTQVNTYHRNYQKLSSDERDALRCRHGGDDSFHAYLAERLAEGAGR